VNWRFLGSLKYWTLGSVMVAQAQEGVLGRPGIPVGIQVIVDLRIYRSEGPAIVK
jgi:hypothetical protein